MKLYSRLGMFALCLSGCLGAQALATSQTNLTCPQKYIATVTNVEDVPAGAFPKVEVDLQVIQTLKGNDVSFKKIQVIKGGPIEFKNGEIYTIESRENWLCSATVFSKT